jgi:hypothetical protein
MNNNLHPDVWADLALLYQAGEASPATRALLEQQATVDSELARRLVADADLAPLKIPAAPATPDVQQRALRSINHWNRLYSTFRGLAFGLTLLPFSFRYELDTHELTFFLWREAPNLCALSLAIGVCCFVAAAKFRKLRQLS